MCNKYTNSNRIVLICEPKIKPFNPITPDNDAVISLQGYFWFQRKMFDNWTQYFTLW